MNILKITFITGVFFLVGCHNNAHLRTQKLLEKDESVISLSGVLPIGGVSESYDYDDETGIVAMRSEVSYLKGFGDYELGPYAGFGFGNFDSPGFVLGFDYRKYTKTKNPHKLGAQFELNFSNAGTLVHIKPSITSAITDQKPNYYGIHGLLYSGELNNRRYYYNNSENITYGFSSLGFGLTFGSEYVFSKLSLQSQVDLSMVKNTFNVPKPPNYDYYMYDDEYRYADPGDEYYLLVGISLGANLFNTSKISSKASAPMPVPIKSKNSKNVEKFDPDTGLKLHGNNSQFDPETGEKRSNPDLNYDPNTGNVIEKSNDENYENDYMDDALSTMEVLSNGEIAWLARENAKKAFISPLWTLSGIASVPLGMTGFLIGGEITFDVLEIPFPVGLIGPIGGGFLGFNIPYQFAYRAKTEIKFPNQLKNDSQRLLYEETYTKKITKRRSDLIRNSQVACVCLPIVLLFGLAVVGG